MSYYFQFDEYPTKDFDVIVEEFIDGSLVARIDEILARIAVEEKEAAGLQTVATKTFYEDREAWIKCTDNVALQSAIQRRKVQWSGIKKQIVDSQNQLSATRDKKRIRQIASAFVDILTGETGSSFVPDVGGYGESARDSDFRFFVQLYEHVMKVDLDCMKEMPTIEDWKVFFRALKPDLLEEEFQLFYKEHLVKEAEQESTRRFCLTLLLTIGKSVKKCIDRGWDLHFFNELSSRDLTARAVKEKRSAYIQSIVDGVLASHKRKNYSPFFTL